MSSAQLRRWVGRFLALVFFVLLTIPGAVAGMGQWLEWMRAGPIVDFATTAWVWRTGGSITVAIIFVGSFLPSSFYERVGLSKVQHSTAAKVRKPPARWKIDPLLFVDTGQSYVGGGGVPILEEQCAIHERIVRYRDEYTTRSLSAEDCIGGSKENVWCEAGGHFLDFADGEYTQLKNLTARAETMLIAERRKQ
jgi:hypothetical protein